MTLSLALSVAALLLSLLSLGLQARTWRLTGPVLTTEVHSAQITRSDPPVVPDGTWTVVVTVVNRGRTAATIDGWGFECNIRWGFDARDVQLFAEPLPIGASLPVRLEPHSSICLYCREDEVTDWLAQENLRPFQVRAWVRPATGEKLYPRLWGVPLH